MRKNREVSANLRNHRGLICKKNLTVERWPYLRFLTAHISRSPAPEHRDAIHRLRDHRRAEPMDSAINETDFLSCCGSTKFAKEMARAAPFASCEQAVEAAREIWRNRVDVNGWLEAFAAHPQIGDSSSSIKKTETSAEWSKGEQSTALATATDSTLQELFEWNALYRQKFGFVFLICASGRSSPEILAELKKRYPNRPIVELEIAGEEQMKVTELRLAKLFTAKAKTTSPVTTQHPAVLSEKPKDRLSVIGAHLIAATDPSPTKASRVSGRSRPPITTHVLDVSRGRPAAGIEVQLEMWAGAQHRPSFGKKDSGEWVFQGSSVTDTDGRSGALMGIIDNITPGIYRISFNTGKYSPSGFFPYVSIVFEIKESQTAEHFHVPLLLSPFSFSTYRGS
ncbi:uric acid degradation bifunctional protein TTL isoform X2 [Magnolia sinica]|uniref:uric acid degradation bifunctional protein TTL isoform X2 n=1 Tax=Magnolia sinica TaxID=86752 RepID=UPI00265AF2B9|nr:uric acid degradation bifunctional protein TTL isoform X2 [Magnolia sinica]